MNWGTQFSEINAISMFWSAHTSIFCFSLPLGIQRVISGRYPKHHGKCSGELRAPLQGWQTLWSPHRLLYGHNHLKEVTHDHVNTVILKELFLFPGCLKTCAALPSSACPFSCGQAYTEKYFSLLIYEITCCPACRSYPRWRSKTCLPAIRRQHLLLKSSIVQEVSSANLTPLGNKGPFSCTGCQDHGKSGCPAALCPHQLQISASAQSHRRHKTDSMQPPDFWPWYTFWPPDFWPCATSGVSKMLHHHLNVLKNLPNSLKIPEIC